MSMEELQQAAKDPAAFEAYVLKKQQAKKKEEEEAAAAAASATGNVNDTNGETKSGRYVPIEQWDKERSRDDMSWEEKVQFDGQRFGNKFQQNEIMRKNLKGW
jgi:hypothetical protein